MNLNDYRFNIIAEISEEGKSVLNLGDTNYSSLTKLLKIRHKVKTLDITGRADYQVDLEKFFSLNKKFDLIIAGEVFEHIYHLKYLLEVLTFNLKKDGQLLISVPNIFNLFDRLKFLFGKMPRQYAYADKHDNRESRGHVRNFNLKEIIDYLESNGFKVVEVYNTGLWFKEEYRLLPSELCPNTWSNNLIILAEVKKEL